MIKLVLCGVLAAGAATGVGFGAASATTAAATTPTCVSAHLKPVFGGQQGAAGTLQDTWRLRNVGAATCQLKGYPAVHNYRADGRPLATSVTHLGTPQTVMLAPGEHASFALRYANPAIAGCAAQPAAMLTIRAPGSALPVITQRGERACLGQLRETPLVHGG
jgi:hypothetical protein